MDGLSVTVEHLVEAGTAGQAAARVIGRVDLAGPVTTLGGALPGGAVAAAAAPAGQAFTSALEAVAGGMTGQADRLTTTAAAYAAAERAVVAALATAAGGRW